MRRLTSVRTRRDASACVRVRVHACVPNAVFFGRSARRLIVCNCISGRPAHSRLPVRFLPSFSDDVNLWLTAAFFVVVVVLFYILLACRPKWMSAVMHLRSLLCSPSRPASSCSCCWCWCCECANGAQCLTSFNVMPWCTALSSDLLCVCGGGLGGE